MASPAGRGAQVRLDGDAQKAARGALGQPLIPTLEAKRVLEFTGIAADGTAPDGSTRTGAAAEDEVLAPGGEIVGGGGDGNYVLPVASPSLLGGVKDGTGVSIAGDGTLSVDYGTTAGTAAQGNDSRITGAAQKSANLSDLTNPATARTNLGLATVAATGAYSDLTGTPVAYTLPTASTTVLGGVKVDGTTVTIASGVISAPGGGGSYTLPVATTSVLGGVKDGTGVTVAGDGTLSVDYGTTAGTAAQGNDSRITGALSTTTAAATYAPIAHSQSASTISDSTTAGRTLLTAADAAAQRTALGLGTAATQASTAFATASHTQAASTISDSTTAGRALLTGANAAAQRTSLGLGTLATISPTGTASSTTFLAGNGVWATPANSTSVSYALHGSSDFPATGDGVADDTAAFNTARDSGKILMLRPDKKYKVVGFIPRSGMTIDGGSGKGYAGDTKDNIVDRALVMKGTGGSAIFAIDGKGHCTFKNFEIDGIDRTARAFGGGGQLMSFENLTIVRCLSGIGSGDGATIDQTYTRTCEMSMVTIADCEIGYDSLIDSNIMGGAVTACVTGVRIVSGANSNNYTALRVEWCVQFGYDIYQSDSNTITGGMTDRNGWAGMHIADITGMLTIQGHIFRRNGRVDAETKSQVNVYFNINSNSNSKCRIVMTGCASEVGPDDGGGGTTTPRWSVGWGGTNSGITLGINDFRAGTTGASTGTITAAPAVKISLSRGLTDQ